MSEKLAVNGDTAIAMAWKQINPDVVAAYPITPQTIIVEAFSDYVHDGQVDTEYVCAESEHSALSICVGSSAAGARVATATASAGLAFMWEMLYIASSMRTPIVMAIANRTLSGPINIHCDHSDAMGARDSGWIQIFGENVQEAYDNTVMAFRIAEHMKVRLPTMTCIDGFIITHALERFEPLEDEAVKKFIGRYEAVRPLLDLKNPTTYGPIAMPDYYFEIKYQLATAMEEAVAVTRKVMEEFGELSGRKYDLVEGYHLDDAEYVIVAMGSTAGTLRFVVDKLRAEGKKVGSLKIRLFRPFPAEDVAKMLKGKKAVAVMDRAMSPGTGGALYSDILQSVHDLKDAPKVTNYVYGLGGRDVMPGQLTEVFEDLMKGRGKRINYMGVRV
ncbi:MAG: Pyruvate synthase subunit PorA [Methanomassiliicoccales archaeon PtaB.Bin134]|nr:MAG: Pyruvate synthase subunit PorA [Methanomassiliicoccales archaeon PtaB.Bin134]